MTKQSWLDVEATATVKHDAFEDCTLSLRREGRLLYVWRTACGSSVAFGQSPAHATNELQRAYANPPAQGPRLISITR